MKPLLSACLLLAAANLSAAAPSLADARQRLLAGNYAEAQDLYKELAKDDKQKGAATVGLSRSLAAVGEFDQALDVVEAALKDLPKDAGLVARKAELLYLRGRWEDAEKAAENAIADSKPKETSHYVARWVRAQIYRDRGELAKADAEFIWFVKEYNNRPDDEPFKDPEQLLLIGLASAERARGVKELADDFSSVINDILADALKVDKKYWPAEYETGMLLLEKYNRGEGADSLDKALNLNPSAAEALVGKGVADLQRYEVQNADRFAERALKINPKLPEALRLKADVHLAAGDAAKALPVLEEAKKVNPRDERTLARIAACHRIQGKKAEVEAVAKEVEKFDAKPALFYFELGERLEERRYFDEAEKDFQKAADLRPRQSGALSSLGMLYMRLGKEKEARPLLDKGFAGDPFNVRVSNMRKVLTHLEKYEKLETDHFLLRYSKADAALAKYMADQLEQIYKDLSEKFKHKIEGKILVEVFARHDMFSGRVIAVPDLHTVGACTGRMFAMVSPNGEGIRKPFNWMRVLRHEIVHIFNLDQTHFLVPHWLTEGLAVSNEGFPRPPAWNEMLRQRVASGKLLTLETIDLGFIRPRDPEEWQLAYCQAQLYVEYLRSKYGKETPAGLLDAYRDGLNTAAAVQKVCKAEVADVEKGYKEYLEKTVKDMGLRPVEKRKTLKELQAAFEKDPNDPDVAAALAEALLARDRAKARELAEKALEKKKGHARASLVLARLARLAGDPKKEKELLEAALDKANPDAQVLESLGKIYYEAKEYPKAGEVFELGRKAEPLEVKWLAELARVYAQTGERDKHIEVLKELAPTDADDLERRKRLTRLLLEAGQAAEAEKYARQCLEIDVRDKEAREAILKALREQKKDDEAKKLEEIFEAK